MESSTKWIITVIVIMSTIIYLNQEVPACIDSPTAQPADVKLNYTQTEISNISEKLESNVLVFETSGESMLPIISDNQRCVCMKTGSYEVGDIVVFFGSSGGDYQGIAHEIIEINSDGKIITKGRNNNFTDIPIKQENILCEIAKLKRWEVLKYG